MLSRGMCPLLRLILFVIFTQASTSYVRSLGLSYTHITRASLFFSFPPIRDLNTRQVAISDALKWAAVGLVDPRISPRIEVRVHFRDLLFVSPWVTESNVLRWLLTPVSRSWYAACVLRVLAWGSFKNLVS